MEKKKAYSIEKLYANCSTANEELDPVEVQLRISLEFSDWCKFQGQPFYRELIQYLDNAKIPEQERRIGDKKIKNNIFKNTKSRRKHRRCGGNSRRGEKKITGILQHSEECPVHSE